MVDGAAGPLLLPGGRSALSFHQQNKGISMLIYGDSRVRMASLDRGSFQTIVTSPPYYNLRDYGVGKMGSETSLAEYVKNLVEFLSLARLALRDDGTLWLNMGDTYKNRQQLGVPWAVAFAMVADGWHLRQDIIWSKPSPMPGASAGKFTNSHEHVFLFSKGDDYFFDADAVREVRAGGEGTRSRRNVWTIAGTDSGLPHSHYAAMPIELARICIAASTSDGGCCASCGAAFARQTVRTKVARDRPNRWTRRVGAAGTGNACANTVAGTDVETIGWDKRCDCVTSDIAKCLVLDPFGGVGSTHIAADDLERACTAIEISAEFFTNGSQRIQAAKERRWKRK